MYIWSKQLKKLHKTKNKQLWRFRDWTLVWKSYRRELLKYISNCPADSKERVLAIKDYKWSDKQYKEHLGMDNRRIWRFLNPKEAKELDKLMKELFGE